MQNDFSMKWHIAALATGQARHIMIPVELGPLLQDPGERITIPGSAVFDTGATFTLMDTVVARSLGIAPVEGDPERDKLYPCLGQKIPEYYDVSVKLGEWRIEVRKCPAAPLGDEITVLIGLDLIRQYLFTVDGPKGIVSLTPSNPSNS